MFSCMSVKNSVYTVFDDTDGALEELSETEYLEVLSLGFMIEGVEKAIAAAREAEIAEAISTAEEKTEESAETGEIAANGKQADGVVTKLYGVLNEAQKDALKSYYLWSSQILFRESPDKACLKLTQKAKVKQEKLDAFKKQGTAWVYAGFIDLEVRGGGHCTLGHALRFKHFAWDTGAADLKTSFWGTGVGVKWDEIERLKADGHIIEFGIDCIGDFFDVPPEQLSLIKKLQRQALTEMGEMFEICSDAEKLSKAKQSFKVLDEIMSVLGKKQALMLMSRQQLPVDNKWLVFHKEFKNKGVLYPRSLVKGIQQELLGLSKEPSRKYSFIENEKLAAVLELLNKNDTPGLVKSLRTGASRMQVNAEYVYSAGTVRLYLENFFRLQMAGIYAYNPYSENPRDRDEGGCNKFTRAVYGSLTGIRNEREKDLTNTNPRGTDYAMGVRITGFEFTLDALAGADLYLEEISKLLSLQDYRTLKIGMYDVTENGLTRTGELGISALIARYSEIQHWLSEYLKNKRIEIKAIDFDNAARQLKPVVTDYMLARNKVQEKFEQGEKETAQREYERKNPQKEDVKTDITDRELKGNCPKCGKTVLESKFKFHCSNSENCNFAVWKANNYSARKLGLYVDRAVVEEILQTGVFKAKGIKLVEEEINGKKYFNFKKI